MRMSALREYRIAKGKKLEDLAEALGVSIPSLSRIERGAQWPTRDFFVRLEAITHGRVTVRDFLPPRKKACNGKA